MRHGIMKAQMFEQQISNLRNTTTNTKNYENNILVNYRRVDRKSVV